jgi:hypothetical protein
MDMSGCRLHRSLSWWEELHSRCFIHPRIMRKGREPAQSATAESVFRICAQSRTVGFGLEAFRRLSVMFRRPPIIVPNRALERFVDINPRSGF